MIQFSKPDVGPQEIAAMKEVVKSGWLTNGPVTEKLESRINTICKTDGCVCLDSCTGALATTLRALGVKEGDEVITTPYTYTATAAVIHHVGAKIVFCDLQPDSFEMDYQKLAELITPRTKAIIPVDIGGKLCDYNAIFDAVFDKRDLFVPESELQAAIGRITVIADAAHSFTSRYLDGLSGQFADFTCFSFHVLKVITTGGEGGAVVWKGIPGIDDERIKYTMKLLSDAGQSKRGLAKEGNMWQYDILFLGHNHIMTDIDAAMGMAQLDRLDGLIAKRAMVTERYNEGLKGVARQLIDHIPEDGTYQTAMHLMIVEIPGGEDQRNEVFNRMYNAGIKCNVHYMPLPMFTAYKSLGFDIKDFPEAYNRFTKVLSLPYHSKLRLEEVDYICEQLKIALQKN